MKNKNLILLALVLVVSIPFNVLAATTLGEDLTIDSGTITVGEDDTGYDVTFYGDTSGKYFLWDASADDMIVSGGSLFSGDVVVEQDAYFEGGFEVTTAAGGLMTLKNSTETPTIGTVAGQIGFAGLDDGGNDVVYSSVAGAIFDDTDTSEGGLLAFSIMDSGTFQNKMILNNSGIQIWDEGTTQTPGYVLGVNSNKIGSYSLTVDNGDVGFDTTTYEDAFFLDFDTDTLTLNAPRLQARLETPDTTSVAAYLYAENTVGGNVYGPLFVGSEGLPNGEFGFPFGGILVDSADEDKGVYFNLGSSASADYQRVRTSARVITQVTDASYTVESTDEYISYQRTDTGTGALDLPAISTLPDGYEITIKDADYNASGNNITVTPNGADTIEDGGSYVMNSNGQAITIVANGSTFNWEVY